MRMIVNLLTAVLGGLLLLTAPSTRAQVRSAASAAARTERISFPLGGKVVSTQVGPHALVRLGSDVDAVRWAARSELAEIRPLNRRLSIWRVRGEGTENGVALAERLANDDAVLDVLPDLYLPRRTSAIDVPPDDPRYGGQWYLDRIDIESAWAIETGSAETTIVVIDNGCDMTHPDLEAAMLGGIDVRDGDDDPGYVPGQLGNEHGTACAGVAAAVGDNGEGIAGVCPECTLRCVRLLGAMGDLTPLSADIAAFTYAFEQGAAVVSNSWGFAEVIDTPPMLRAVVEDLYDNGRDGRGTLVVFAAGNENRELENAELTAVRGVINVGAVNLFDEAAPYNNFGTSLDLAAPTGSFTTDIQGPDGASATNYTDLFGGTSSACPVVAGVAGLLFSADPEARAREVHDILLDTARPAPFALPNEEGHDPLYGYGIVDPASALRALIGIEAPTPDAGAADAGSAHDGGRSADGGGAGANEGGGCGCRAGTGERNGPAIVVAAALLAFARRRARRTRTSRH